MSINLGGLAMLRSLVVVLLVVLCCTAALAGGGYEKLLYMYPVEKSVSVDRLPVISWRSPVQFADYDRISVELVGWDVGGNIEPSTTHNGKFIVLKPIPGLHPVQKRHRGEPAMLIRSEIDKAEFILVLVVNNRHWRLPAIVNYNTLKSWPAGPFRPNDKLVQLPYLSPPIVRYGLFRPLK